MADLTEYVDRVLRRCHTQQPKEMLLVRIQQLVFERENTEKLLQDAVTAALDEGFTIQHMIRLTEERAGTIEAWRVMSRERAERREALDELTRTAQEDGLYDDPEANEFSGDTRLPTPENWARRNGYPGQDPL